MSPGAAQVFVYYRVQAVDAAAAIAAVRTFQNDLQALMPGLNCTLSQRADDSGELLTLMETYAHAEGVGPAWTREIERLAHDALAAWTVGERHLEVFVPCA